MSSEIIDLTVDTPLPEYIKLNWLPLEGLSVPHLFQFVRYPPSETLYYNYPHLDQLLHGDGVTDFNPYILLQLGPPPSALSDAYKAVVRTSPSPIHSFTLIPLSGDPV